jgi:hypothetical protein
MNDIHFAYLNDDYIGEARFIAGNFVLLKNNNKNIHMNNLGTHLLLGFFLSICLCSCGGKDKNLANANILTSKSWKRGLVDKNPSTNPNLDYGSNPVLYSAIPTCQQDDILHFSSNSTLTIDNGANKCSSNEQATETVNYSYNETNKEVTIDGVKYQVAEMSSSQIKYYAPLPPPTSYSYIIFLLQ